MPDTVSLDQSFFSLTPERVLESVEVGGRRATGYALALNSLENRVYEVELEDGERLVAKFYRPGRWPRAAIREEHRFLAELAAEEIPVVPPIALGGMSDGALDGGETIGEIGGIYYSLFPKARGRVPEEPGDAELERFGRLLARLHNVGARHGAPDRPTLTPESYGSASLRVLLGGDHGGPFIPPELSASYRRAVEIIIALAETAWHLVDPIRLHGDCHLGNILWGADGPFFLDFDDFLAGPAVQDLWLVAPGADSDGTRQREVMVEAYETMRRFDRRTLRLVEPLRALRIIRYAAWIALRWQDPSFARAFPDFTEFRYWQNEVQVLEQQLERVRAVVG